MTFVPLADWYPEMDRLWRDHGRRLWVGTANRLGWTVHHTAGSFGSWLDYARWVADFHYWTRGWRRPGGYSFLIPRTPPDGLALEMCGTDWVGAHAAGANVDDLGVAFEGNFTSRLPTEAQLDCFARLVTSIDIPQRQRRHRDVTPTTACPGDRLSQAVPLPLEEHTMSWASWAVRARDWATTLGIVTDDTRPKDTATIEQVVVLLHRYHQSQVEALGHAAELKRYMDGQGSSPAYVREVIRHVRDHPDGQVDVAQLAVEVASRLQVTTR